MGMQPLWTFTTNSIGLETISVSALVTCPLLSHIHFSQQLLATALAYTSAAVWCIIAS